MNLVRSFVVVSIALIPAFALAREPRIDPGADDWVIASDIPPFALGLGATLVTGGGLNRTVVGDLPGNVSAGADYEDSSRGMLVEVRVTAHQQADFLDHFIEAAFRDADTARMSAESSMVTVAGGAMYFFCDAPPNCRMRLYQWRSGSGTVVSVEAKAHTTEMLPDGAPRMERVSCDEPSEIVAAYLSRYPSSLSVVPESDDRAGAWRRAEVEIRLAAAEHALSRSMLAPVIARSVCLGRRAR